MKTTLEDLKSRFETGDRPTGQDFIDLIDTSVQDLGHIVESHSDWPASVTVTEVGYLDGVSSAIQPQINLKAPLASPTFTGTVSGITKDMVGLDNVDNTADVDKNVLSATKFTTSRTINGVGFDGTSNIVVEDATKLPLAGGTLSGDLTVTGSFTVNGTNTVVDARVVDLINPAD
jgi:hypothetical protein